MPAIIAMAIVGQIVNPVFLHHDNLINVLQTMSEIGAAGARRVAGAADGKMDLSLESTFGLAPGVAAWIIAPTGVAHGLGALGNAWAIPLILVVGRR